MAPVYALVRPRGHAARVTQVSEQTRRISPESSDFKASVVGLPRTSVQNAVDLSVSLEYGACLSPWTHDMKATSRQNRAALQAGLNPFVECAKSQIVTTDRTV